MTSFSSDISRLTTESADARFADIDLMSTDELARAINEEDAGVPQAVSLALPQIVAAIDAIAQRMEQGGRLIYVGAGTPGRIGVLDASEWPPTFGTSPEQTFAIIAGGTEAIRSSLEGAEDDAPAGAEAIDRARVGVLDTVVGIASSGRTPFVLAAVRRARALGALTVGLSCNAQTELSSLVEHPIEVLVGAEIVSGSTRMKAGTAQKFVLNMVSTIVNVRLGKTYGNLMVDVRANNAKLRERAVGIVQAVTGITGELASATLESTGYRVKEAIVVLKLAVTPEVAASRLAAHSGRLRRVLDEA